MSTILRDNCPRCPATSQSRAGGIRTPDHRFWRPALCQTELPPCAMGFYAPSCFAPQQECSA